MCSNCTPVTVGLFGLWEGINGPFTLPPNFGRERIKQAPVPFLSMLGQPIYTVQVWTKLVRVPVLSVSS